MAQLDVLLGKFVGEIASRAIVRKQLSKLHKDKAALTAKDCKTLTQNILTAVSRFVTKEEAGKLHREMDKLFITHFS